MNPRTLIKLILIPTTLFQLTACNRGTVDSNLVSADTSGDNQIHREYRVSHKEDSNQTMASATFSLGGSWGTTVRLVSPATISINGKAMNEDMDVIDGGEIAAFYAGFIFPLAWYFAGDNGTHYYKTIPNSGAYTFEWTDPQGRIIRDSVSELQMQLLTPATTPHGQDITLHINGLDESANISVQIGEKYGIKERLYFYSSPITIPAADLLKYQAGNIYLRIEVDGTSSLPADGNGGGSIAYSYQFSERKINLR